MKKKERKEKTLRLPYTSGNNLLQNSYRFKCDTVKLPEENIKKNFFQYLGLDRKFLDLIPGASSIKGEVDKLDLIKIKNICCEKDPVKKKGRQITDWERMFADHILNKALVFRIHELQKLNVKKSDLKVGRT